METFIFILAILSAYIFGFMSGIIYERKTNKEKEMIKALFKKDQTHTLSKTKKKKVYDLYNDMPGGFGTFGPGNSNGPASTIKESTYPIPGVSK